MPVRARVMRLICLTRPVRFHICTAMGTASVQACIHMLEKVFGECLQTCDQRLKRDRLRNMGSSVEDPRAALELPGPQNVGHTRVHRHMWACTHAHPKHTRTDTCTKPTHAPTLTRACTHMIMGAHTGSGTRTHTHTHATHMQHAHAHTVVPRSFNSIIVAAQLRN